jgi:hypothetical protein
MDQRNRVTYWDHEQAIINCVCELMDKGYRCYLEEIIGFSTESKHSKIQVDIYARKEEKEIIIEVGTLNEPYGISRAEMVKKIKPKAKFIHITQWKNYGITGTELLVGHFNWLMQNRYDKYPVR